MYKWFLWEEIQTPGQGNKGRREGRQPIKGALPIMPPLAEQLEIHSPEELWAPGYNIYSTVGSRLKGRKRDPLHTATLPLLTIHTAGLAGTSPLPLGRQTPQLRNTGASNRSCAWLM